MTVGISGIQRLEMTSCGVSSYYLQYMNGIGDGRVCIHLVGLGGKGGLAGWRRFSVFFLSLPFLFCFGQCIASAGIWVGVFLSFMFMLFCCLFWTCSLAWPDNAPRWWRTREGFYGWDPRGACLCRLTTRQGGAIPIPCIFRRDELWNSVGGSSVSGKCGFVFVVLFFFLFECFSLVSL